MFSLIDFGIIIYSIKNISSRHLKFVHTKIRVMKTITNVGIYRFFVVIAFKFYAILKTNGSKYLLKLIILFSGIFLSSTANAQVQKALTPRYNESLRGDFIIIANNMISRNATANYDGLRDNQDYRDNVYVDIDNDASTFNSSSAVFENPEPSLTCLLIKKVYLYWAATDKEQDNGDDNQPNWNFNDVKLILPGETNYTTVTADDIIYRGRDTHFSNDPYVCVKDITDRVNALSSPYGNYQLANIEGKKDELQEHFGVQSGPAGGWEIVFVYESPYLPARNITLFDGYAHVTRNVNNFDIDFNGFLTVPFGQVNADMLIGVLEGDRNLLDDQLQIVDVSNTYVNLSTPLRDANNFFNSKITVNGSDFLNRIPASSNTTGFDASVFYLDNPGNSIIANNQTSATIRMTSSAETYGLFLLGLSVEVWEPDLAPIYLTHNTVNAIESPDNVLNFNMNFANTGNDHVRNLELSATLPPQVLFESASNLPAGVTYTFNNATNVLTFYYQDGLMDVGDPALDIEFNLKVNNECYFLENNCDLSFTIQFEANYNGATNPTPQTDYSSASTNQCIPNEPLIVNVQQPLIDWATPLQSLNRTIECNDTIAFNDAGLLEPMLDKCVFILNKTVGTFVQDANCSNSGTYTNTWSFDADCSNPIPDYVQVITVVDTSAPTFVETLPSDMTVQCDTTPVAENLTATDNCGTATVTLSEVRTDGSCNSNYTLTRTWTATDSCGNATTHTQTITVEDSSPPSFVEVLPVDITVECDNIPAPANLTATNNCGAATVTFNEIKNNSSCPNNYVLLRTWTATDDCGLSTSYTQTISVQDNTAPTFIGVLPIDTTVECDNIPEPENLAATDNCGTATVTFNEVRNNSNCPNSYTLLRTWTAIDDCGTSVSFTQTISVEDNIPPSLLTSLDSEITLECSAIPDIPELEFMDGCTTNVTVNFNEQTVQTTQDNYDLIRTWIVSDNCNNSSTFSQTIHMLFNDSSTNETLIICIDQPVLDLNTLVDTSYSGTWTSNSMEVLNGSLFDPAIVPEGDYTFTYTSNNNQCIITNVFDINLNDDCIEYPCIKSLFDVDISKLVTPNGDLDNETFNVAYILNDKIDDLSTCDIIVVVKIFNRWGTKLFESHNYNNEWTGNTPNSTIGTTEKLPTGTYYYVVELINSGLKPIQGFIYLGTEQ